MESVWPPLDELKERITHLKLDHLKNKTKTSTETNWGDIYKGFSPSIKESIEEVIFPYSLFQLLIQVNTRKYSFMSMLSATLTE